MKLWIMALAVSACASHKTTSTDATSGDGAHDGAPISDGSQPDAHSCTPAIDPASGGCCVFDGLCGSGLACYYAGGSLTADPTPTIAEGACYPDGARAEGDACYQNNASGQCAPGLYCAWNNGQIMQTGSGAGMGTCRQLCTPTDAAHGCPTGKTCVGMPKCQAGESYPSCSSDPGAGVGYCMAS